MTPTTTVWRACRAVNDSTGYQCTDDSGHDGPHSMSLDGDNGLVWPRQPKYDPDAEGCSQCWNTFSAGRHGTAQRMHCGFCGRGLRLSAEAHRPSGLGWPA